MTLLELVERIKQTALEIGGPVLDTDIIVEILLPRVLDVVASNAVKDEQGLNALRANHNVVFTAGVGALPTYVKEDYADSFAFVDNEGASYKKSYFDFAQSNSDFVDSFHVANSNIYFRQKSSIAGQYGGTLVINAVTTPSLPTLSSDTVTLRSNLLEQVIASTAAIIKGEIPLAYIGLNIMPKSKK